MRITFKQFKEGIKKHATILRVHGLLDPADRVEKGFKRHKRLTNEEKAVQADLIDELFEK